MGANVGTTVTAQLVSFNIEKYAPIAIGIGMAFWFFTKKKNVKNISEILIGFGILFVGMNFMKLPLLLFLKCHRSMMQCCI